MGEYFLLKKLLFLLGREVLLERLIERKEPLLILIIEGLCLCVWFYLYLGRLDLIVFELLLLLLQWRPLIRQWRLCFLILSGEERELFCGVGCLHLRVRLEIE